MANNIDITTTDSVSITVDDAQSTNVTVTETASPEVVIETTEQNISVNTTESVSIEVEQVVRPDVSVSAVTIPKIVVGGAGGSGDVHYIFPQDIPSALWTITHNLNKKPSVTVVSSADTVMYGDITYLNTNKLTITFSAPFSGKAYLN
jgi:hypothetical protein